MRLRPARRHIHAPLLAVAALVAPQAAPHGSSPDPVVTAQVAEARAGGTAAIVAQRLRPPPRPAPFSRSVPGPTTPPPASPSPVPDEDGTVPTVDACVPLRLLSLQPRPEHIPELTAAGVDLVTLELGWDAYQPAADRWSADYAARRAAEAGQYAAAGLEVVLDLGLQYPPTWAWSLPGPTRFVNQYGEEWRGTTGTDAINGVWNPAVRQAQERYVRQVARDLEGVDLAAVRIGGLLSGELRLPPARTATRTDALWAFDPLARAASPVPGWQPGTGTPEEAEAWLDHYLDALVDYQAWLADVVTDAFPGTSLDVLLPGWGLRPGDLERAARERVSRASVEATGDSLSSAVDWGRHVASLAERGADATLVTTWLDAPAYGPAARDQAPVEHLVGLARRAGLPVTGENTGGGGRAALDRTMQQAARFDLERVTWLALPDDPQRVSLAEVGAARDAAVAERCRDRG